MVIMCNATFIKGDFINESLLSKANNFKVRHVLIIPEILSSKGFSDFTFTHLNFPSTRNEFSTVNTSSFDYLDNHLQQSL